MWPTFYIPLPLNLNAKVELIAWVCTPQTQFYKASTGILNTASAAYPSNIRKGDLIIVDMCTHDALAPPAASILPAGFTRIMETRQSGPIGYKFADGTESGTIDFSFYILPASGGGGTSYFYKFCILVIRNANSDDPFGAFAGNGGDTQFSAAVYAPKISSGNPDSLHLFLTQCIWNLGTNKGLDYATPMDVAELVGGAPYANRVESSTGIENSYFVFRPGGSAAEIENLLTDYLTVNASWSTTAGLSRLGRQTSVDLVAGETYTFAAAVTIAINANNLQRKFYLSATSPSSGEATAWFQSDVGGYGSSTGSMAETGNMSGCLNGSYAACGDTSLIGSGTATPSIGGMSFTAPETGTYVLQVGRCNADGAYTYFGPNTFTCSWACLATKDAPVFPTVYSWDAAATAFSGREGTRGRGWWLTNHSGGGYNNEFRGFSFEIVPKNDTRPLTYLDVLHNKYAHVIAPDSAAGIDASTSLFRGAAANKTSYQATQMRGKVMGSRKFYCEFQMSRAGSTTGLSMSVQGCRSTAYSVLNTGSVSPINLENNCTTFFRDNEITQYQSATTVQAASGSVWTTTDWIGVGLDTANGVVEWYKNGTLIGSWTMLYDDDLFSVRMEQGGNSDILDVNANFTGPFGGRKPSGYVAWDWEHEVA